ncbi:hypothetical protein [Nocardia sp. NPDC005825]|uniref:hypothetical protein n=1 Tax=unclassified Nocardia TaxID=2637762 RepID=UPI0033F0C647
MPAAMVYTCRVTSWTMFSINIFALALNAFNLASASSSGASRWSVAFAAVVLLLTAPLIVVAIGQRVTAGPTGVTVSLGPLGLPRIRVARASIAHAEMTIVKGSGVHWGPKRGWSLTPKAGPALRLRLTSGRKLVISMPEPGAAMLVMGIPQ